MPFSPNCTLENPSRPASRFGTRFGAWIALKATPEYQEVAAQRHRVEQTFGSAKQKPGFERYPPYWVSKQNRTASHFSGAQPQTDGRTAHRIDLPTASQEQAGGSDQTDLCPLTLGLPPLTKGRIRLD